MPAPLIGVTTSVTVDKSPERAYVNASYLRAVEGAGGIPVLLPPHLSEQARHALWERLDGVLLTGGGDIDPARFHEPPHPTVMEVSPLRDALEIEVVERALGDGIPLLAICRGLQVLNVALGGTLYQDLPADKPTSLVAHSQKEPRDQPTHAVKVMAEGTRLASIVGASEIEVNSFHHQAIKRLAAGLREVAWAPDGVIEAVEMDGPRFVVAVQWHPEDLVAHDPAARSLFVALTRAASH
jgi:putative glutamine amidotransferase